MAVFNFGRRMTDKENKIMTRTFWIIFGTAAAIFYGLSIFLFGWKHIPSWFSLTYDGILLLNLTYFMLRTIPHIRAMRREIKAIEKRMEEDSRRRSLRIFNSKEIEEK